jgi:hypothetical protein
MALKTAGVQKCAPKYIRPMRRPPGQFAGLTLRLQASITAKEVAGRGRDGHFTAPRTGPYVRC